jgi:hypothetical protein
MNKRKGDFHRWIVDEWVKAGTPKVHFPLRVVNGYFMDYYWRARLWSHECGKHYVVNDTVEMGKR